MCIRDRDWVDVEARMEYEFSTEYGAVSYTHLTAMTNATAYSSSCDMDILKSVKPRDVYKRQASYMARYIAKNIVASGICDKIEIEVAYAIGVARPVSIYVNTYGTSKLSDEKIVEIINENFDLRPTRIIEHLDLRRPIYRKTAAYGHFGRNEFPWEKLDKAEVLKKYL